MSGPVLTGLTLGDAPERWQALGFTVMDGVLELGGVRLTLTGAGGGILGWSVQGLAEANGIDGLPRAETAEPAGAPVHSNGAAALDHVVVATPDFDRTSAAFEAAGLSFRRVRDAGGFRQGFRRLGPAILEVVEAHQAPVGPARFWGLVPIAADLETLHDRLGPDVLAAPKPAVQPGRLIATVRRAAGLGQPVAFISPEPDPATVPEVDDEPEQGAYPPP